MNNHMTLVLKKQQEFNPNPMFMTIDGIILTRVPADVLEGYQWAAGSLTFKDGLIESFGITKTLLSAPTFSDGTYLKGVLSTEGRTFKIYPRHNQEPQVFLHHAGVACYSFATACPWCQDKMTMGEAA